jgi:hypothetical protein
MGTIMSILEGGVFIIVGCLGTMRVLVASRSPSRGPLETNSNSNSTGKKWEPSLEVDKDIPLLSVRTGSMPLTPEKARPVAQPIASYDFYNRSELS